MSDESLRSIAESLERIERALSPKRERPWRNPHDRDSMYDAAGRKLPRRFDLALACRAVPAFARRFRRVPARAVVEAGLDDDGIYALVECPCSHKPVVREALRQCPGCERWFMVAGDLAWVFYGDMEPPSVASATEGTAP